MRYMQKKKKKKKKTWKLTFDVRERLLFLSIVDHPASIRQYVRP